MSENVFHYRSLLGTKTVFDAGLNPQSFRDMCQGDSGETAKAPKFEKMSQLY